MAKVADQRMRQRTLSIMALVTIAAVSVWGHEGHQPLPTRGVQVDVGKGLVTISADSRKVLDVGTHAVAPRVVEDRLLAYASLVAPWQRHAFVTARIPGRLVRVDVLPGQIVQRGERIADLQPLELESYQLDLLNARNDLKLSKKLLDVIGPLAEQGTVATKEVREARAKHVQNLGAMDIAKARLVSVGIAASDIDGLLATENPQLLRSLPVVSPLGGTVIHLDAMVGKVVEASEHLMEITDPSSLWVKIGVLEQDLAKVQEGMQVELTLTTYPREIFRSTIRVKESRLDSQTHVGVVWAELANSPDRPARLLPGMSGQAQIILPTAKKLAVPAEALIAEGAEKFVLVENTTTAAASEYQKRPVVTGATADRWVQILQGEVYAGDRVVTTGNHQIASLLAAGVLRLSPEATRNIGLEIRPVVPRIVETVLAVDGAIELPPNHRAFVSTQLSGVLQKIRVDRNQQVRAGDVVAEIASPELQSLQFEMLRAHLQMKVLEQTIQGLRSGAELSERRPLWEAESAFNETRNRRDSARRKLEAIGLSAEQTNAILTEQKFLEAIPVRTPINGVVVQFLKILGQAVKTEEPLFEIHDLGKVQVQAFLSEREVSQVQVGQSARVRLTSDATFVREGKVVRRSPSLGPDSRTVSVWIEMDGPPPPAFQNMLARVTFILDRPAPTLAVPLDSVVREGTRRFVFIRGTEGAFERKLVTSGRADDRWIEIIHGLRAGEEVVFHGSGELQTAFASLR